MAFLRTILLITGLFLCVGNRFAAQTQFSVPMDYRLIRSVLINQLYTGEGDTARLWKDGKDCSFLDLSNPQINADNGQIKIENQVHAKIGLQLGGKCMSVLAEWHGILQTWQQPSLDANGSVLSFPITQTLAFDHNGKQLAIKQLQDLINKAVQSKLADLKIDLNQSRGDIIKTLLPFIDPADTETLQDTVDSLRFKQVKAGKQALSLNMGFSGFTPKHPALQAAAAFNAGELQQWQTHWRQLEQDLENGLNRPPLDQQSEADKATLREILQEAGVAFDQGLTADDIADHDPVRGFFNDSWDKLAPLLRNASKQLPGAEGLRYLTLIAATDLMYELEAISKPLGLEISANGLRKLARAYLAHQAGLR